MMFALGYIAGVVTCVFIFVVITATKAERFVSQMANVSREAVKNIAPGAAARFGNVGFVDIPPDDDDLARQEIIDENRAQGKDTPIKDLQ